MNKEIVGFASATICSVSVITQNYKSWKTKSSGDISTQTIVLVYMAMFLGVVYGALIDHVAVYVGNSVSLALYIVLHCVKIRNDRLASPEWVPVPELEQAGV